MNEQFKNTEIFQTVIRSLKTVIDENDGYVLTINAIERLVNQQTNGKYYRDHYTANKVLTAKNCDYVDVFDCIAIALDHDKSFPVQDSIELANFIVSKLLSEIYNVFEKEYGIIRCAFLSDDDMELIKDFLKIYHLDIDMKCRI